MGASFTDATSTLTCTALADSPPLLSRAFTVKAFNAVAPTPKALATGVHSALWSASIRSLVPAAQALPLRVKLPLLTACTTKACTAPPGSAALDAASSLLKLIALGLSSSPPASAVTPVSVGATLAAVSE